KPACWAATSVVRFINGKVWDWNWVEHVVTSMDLLPFQVIDGTFDRVGNYICCGESKNQEDVGMAALLNPDGRELDSYPLMHRAKQLALSPDESQVAFCTSNGIIEIHAYPKAKKEALHFFFASGPALATAWSNSGRYLAVALVKGGIETWELSSEKRLNNFLEGIKLGARFAHLAFVPTFERLFLLADALTGTTYLCDWQQGQIIKMLPRVLNFAFSPSGNLLALAYADGKVTIAPTTTAFDNADT
ncbi:MAG: WD40 repeat domain-containing protein, partial [Phaeodactylibacter sp.]|nr:WD40 repeat domain-containing protein [Phaeodactylibacter sp.]